ncbi:MAG TPA: aldo/keto reductase [Candidatus Hydrogenedentes bacterium]|mgnify:FL=1|nr:aldo/keto reductase [Candidatus Hydrogenedentota bacterium]HQH50838.1 aldo/keto reductase [Candidatus Hydrogenedentota bacterium]
MQYRPFGKTGFDVSALGFGTMRLPVTGGDPANIDRRETIRMIRHAIDNGVNYVDSAYAYHNGQSEVVLGEALRDGYRGRVKIATKLPTWLVQEEEDVEKLLDTQLERLQQDRIDFYLVHNLNNALWPIARDRGVLPALERARDKGKIGHIGFSFHDSFELFKEIIDAYDGWEFVQIQYNYVNETVQAGTKGLEYAASQGLPVVVMEPLLGGCLVNPPEPIREIFQNSPYPERSPVDWALQWLWNHPEIATVLSGMGAMSQVEENLACAGRSGIGALSDEEMETISDAAYAFRQLTPVPCTKCGYCMPCPNGVDIPRNLDMYNNVHIFKGNQDSLNRIIYINFMAKEARADKCTVCNECLPKCPQHIKIPELLPKVHETLSRPLS